MVGEEDIDMDGTNVLRRWVGGNGMDRADGGRRRLIEDNAARAAVWLEPLSMISRA